MTLRDRLGAYRDQHGLITPQPGGSCGNGPLFLAEAYILGYRLGLIEPQDRSDLLEGLGACEKARGLYQRHPVHFTQDQEGPDDYYGIAAICQIFGLRWLAYNVLEHGRKHLGSFNNITPGKWTKQSWLWRQPQMKAAFQYAVGEEPAFWRRVVIAGAIATAGRGPETGAGWEDSWVLTWMLIEAVGGRCWMARLAERAWLKRFEKKVPGGWAQVFTAYFGPDHPITGMAKELGGRWMRVS